MTTKLSQMYWNGNGIYQDKLKEMEAAGFNEKYTKKSKATARRYYRFHNDGDIPKGMGFGFSMHEIAIILERQANEMVLSEYNRFLRLNLFGDSLK